MFSKDLKDKAIKGGLIVGGGILAFALTPWWVLAGAGAYGVYTQKDKIKNIWK
jgi:hypothetical protein